jgi:predicted GIY-YIG superfamily endonuclease
MSQKVDYSKSVIYKLCCKDPLIEDIYIGSTTNMKVRKGHHKSLCNNQIYKTYNYQFIRENGGFENWDMIMIEEYSCNSKKELEKRERYWIDELKPSLNSIRPYISKEELKKLKKKHIENNKEYQKKYRDKNKEKINCDLCGDCVLKTSLNRHQNTMKCKKHHVLLFSDDD